MTKEELKQEAEEKYCNGCKWRIEQCLWAWRNTNGLNEPNEKNCSCKEIPAFFAGAKPREKRIADLEKENAGLKEEINKIAFARGNLEEENAELKESLKKWKDEWQEQVQKATDEGYARTLQTMKLTKAKELLKQFLNAKNGEDTYKAEWEAEQFLNSEVEK